MRTRLLILAAFLVGSFAVAPGASAHHAWHGYDMDHITTVKGTVTKFDWSNPHVWMNFDVKDENGNIEKWAAGGPSPSRMAGKGWDKDTLKTGDQITAVGHRISDGTYSIRLEKVILADGRELLCYGDR
jgi:Family of unknown function (DUF6152)